jgi:uncharacterized protein YndB with AHSA1/START domain
MSTGTVRLHRVLRAKPERIYRAFVDAAAMAKWLPPYSYTCTVQHMDARVGGTYKMSFTNFTTGHGHSFGGKHRELVPFERHRYTDRFDDPNLRREMQTTVTLKQVSCGTELIVARGPRPFHWRSAISAGRSRSRSLPRWSSPGFRRDQTTPDPRLDADVPHPGIRSRTEPPVR